MISAFFREVDENYAASIRDLLPTFRDNQSVPFSGVRNSLVCLRLYLYENISLNFSYNEKCFRQKI